MVTLKKLSLLVLCNISSKWLVTMALEGQKTPCHFHWKRAHTHKHIHSGLLNEACILWLCKWNALGKKNCCWRFLWLTQAEGRECRGVSGEDRSVSALPWFAPQELQNSNYLALINCTLIKHTPKQVTQQRGFWCVVSKPQLLGSPNNPGKTFSSNAQQFCYSCPLMKQQLKSWIIARNKVRLDTSKVNECSHYMNDCKWQHILIPWLSVVHVLVWQIIYCQVKMHDGWSVLENLMMIIP